MHNMRLQRDAARRRAPEACRSVKQMSMTSKSIRISLVALVGIVLAAFLLMKFTSVTHRDPANPTLDAFHYAYTAITTYRLEYGEYPNSFIALLPTGNDRGIAFIEDLTNLNDSWDQSIRYSILEDRFDLQSAGPDRSFDNNDDIIYTKTEDTEHAPPAAHRRRWP